MALEEDGFFSRWSRRKTAVKAGTAQDAMPQRHQDVTLVAPLPSTPVQPDVHPTPEPPPPAVTLDDVQALTPESDFRPFVARQVAPVVRNAAMKKLFADPHFNVMDGLDIYIDDYSRPDPLAPEVLRQLLRAHGRPAEVAAANAVEHVAQPDAARLPVPDMAAGSPQMPPPSPPQAMPPMAEPADPTDAPPAP